MEGKEERGDEEMTRDQEVGQEISEKDRVENNERELSENNACQRGKKDFGVKMSTIAS